MKRGLVSLLFLLLLVGAVSAEYYPYEYEQYPQPAYQPRYGYGGVWGFGVFDFNSIYDQYHLFFDAVIYGFIFFGIGSLVFKKPEQRPLYIGLGLFMTAALLLFEARQTFRLLDIAGPWAVLLLIAMLSLMVFKITYDNFGKNKIISGTLAVITAVWLLSNLAGYVVDISIMGDLVYFVSSIPFWAWGIAGIFLIFFFLHKKEGGSS